MILEALVWGIFGLILGSFTNVLILREGVASLGGRSACPSCTRTLEWYELVPVVSWLILRGKCRTCSVPISIQYPLVELCVGAGCALLGAAVAPFFLTLLGAVIIVLLVAITVYDLYYTLIPDRWAYGLAATALLYGILARPPSDVSDALLFLVSGPLVAAPLVALWAVSRGRWMGLGDGKLVLGFGWLVGLLPGFVALLLAFILGAMVGVCILIPLQKIAQIAARHGITRFLLRDGRFTIQSEVPFGPFLVSALCFVWFSALYGFDVPHIVVGFLSLNSWSSPPFS